MNRKLLGILLLVVLVASGCGGANVADDNPAANNTQNDPSPTVDSSPRPTPEQPPDPPPVPLTELVGGILADPGGQKGAQIEIVGYFRGWDMFDEAKDSVSVTRSDWVIKDASGAIYVTGIEPAGLDPGSTEHANTVIRLTANVQVKGDQAYLEGTAVEIVEP